MPLVPDPNMFGPASLSVAQGIGAFQVFLPKFDEIRKAHPADNPDFAADVRMGEVAACTVTLGVGAIASSLTGSAIPAITAVVVCAILVALYESTLRVRRPMEAKPKLTIVEGDANA